MATSKSTLPAGSYFLQPASENSDFVEVCFVAPCGKIYMCAIVEQASTLNPNPLITWMQPNIGINGVIKIGKLLENWKTQLGIKEGLTSQGEPDILHP